MQAKLICHMGEQLLLRVLVPRGPAVVRGKQRPHGHGPARPGRRQATFEVRGEQDPCGHGPECPRRRAGDLCGQGQAGAPWTWRRVSGEKGRGPLRSGVNRIPVDMAPRVRGEGQGPLRSSASRIPVDMALHVRGEGHGCPFASLPVSP